MAGLQDISPIRSARIVTGGPCAHAGRRGAASQPMLPADNDDVKLHGSYPVWSLKIRLGLLYAPLRSFSNAKAGKYAAKQFLGINLACDPASSVSCAPVVFSRQLGPSRNHG